MATERLQKILAAAGVASRRGSEALIAAGRVTVDGKVATLGQQVDPASARIEVDRQPIGGSAAPVYLALHKPAGVTSTNGAGCLICQLHQHFSATVISVPPSVAPLALTATFVRSHAITTRSQTIVTRTGRAPPQISC